MRNILSPKSPIAEKTQDVITLTIHFYLYFCCKAISDEKFLAVALTASGTSLFRNNMHQSINFLSADLKLKKFQGTPKIKVFRCKNNKKILDVSVKYTIISRWNKRDSYRDSNIQMVSISGWYIMILLGCLLSLFLFTTVFCSICKFNIQKWECIHSGNNKQRFRF